MDNPAGKKLLKTASGLRMIPTSENYASPFALGEPMWTPDKEATQCSDCQRTFDFMNRRHHCRRCGKCFCGLCCSHQLPLKRMYFIDPVRQCYSCAVVSRKEQEFYEKGLKVLMAGTLQTVFQGSIGEPDVQKSNLICRLSPDFRYFEFAPPNSVRPPPVERVLLSKVIGAHIHTDSQTMNNSPDRHIATGISLKYKDEEDSSIIHDLHMHSVDQRSSASFMAWSHRALKMIFESRKQTIQ